MQAHGDKPALIYQSPPEGQISELSTTSGGGGGPSLWWSKVNHAYRPSEHAPYGDLSRNVNSVNSRSQVGDRSWTWEDYETEAAGVARGLVRGYTGRHPSL